MSASKSPTPASATRILLVDDDAIYRERLVRAFRGRGYDTRGVGTGASAVECAREFAPTHAVLDLRLPDTDGLAVLKELQARATAPEVLMLTGFGSIANALEAVRRGARDYRTKPADANQILAALGLADGMPDNGETDGAPASLDRVEWEHIQRVLADCGGNVSQAAKWLGIHRRSLQRKLARYPAPR